MSNTYILHSGVKGMRWGVRRYQNEDGSLTEAGRKRYGYGNSLVSTQKRKFPVGAKVDGYEEHKPPLGAKVDGPPEFTIPKDAMLATIERFKTKFKQKVNKETVTKTVVKGANVATKLAVASALDDLYIGGAGKRMVKKTAVQTGRAAVTAYTMARGGYDIRWYDK